MKDKEQRKWYAVKVIENGWTEGVILNQIATNLYLRQGENEHKTTNYLDKIDLDQAKKVLNIFKDPYLFDFAEFTE